MYEAEAKQDHMWAELPAEVVYMRVADDQTEDEEHVKEDKNENEKE